MSTQLMKLCLPTSKAHVFYREAGLECAPVILLLHGFPSSSHQYRNLIPIWPQKTKIQQGVSYTFDTLAAVMGEFRDILSITKFSVFIFDYGAPAGLRLALERSDTEDGLGEFWKQIRELWTSNNDSKVHSKLAGGLLSLEATKSQYEEGTKRARPVNADIQLDLFWDYLNNTKVDPEFHQYFQTFQVPLLARDLPAAKVHILDAEISGLILDIKPRNGI
ncbi:Alpha/Beta hydrolase protein [Aspergillus spectabilis]